MWKPGVPTVSSATPTHAYRHTEKHGWRNLSPGHSPWPGRTCLLQTPPGESRAPSLLQLQPKGKHRKDCASTLTFFLKWLFSCWNSMFYVCNIFTQYQLSVSAGVTQGLPHANQGSTQHFNPLLPEPWPLLFPSQAFSPFRKHQGAWRSFPGLAGQGREMNTRYHFTIVLREKSARF